MRDKSGCLSCHFLCTVSTTREGLEADPLPGESRSRDNLSMLIPKLDLRINSVKCFFGEWDSAKIDAKNAAEIEGVVFRKDRGRKCPQFSPKE